MAGLTFSTHFIGSERNVPAAALGARGLHYTTSDASLIGHLGGETRAAVPFLAYIHRLMEMGDNGDAGCDFARAPGSARPGNARGREKYAKWLPQFHSVGDRSLGATDPQGRLDDRLMPAGHFFDR